MSEHAELVAELREKGQPYRGVALRITNAMNQAADAIEALDRDSLGLLRHIDVVITERDEAVADNAALLAYLRGGQWLNSGRFRFRCCEYEVERDASRGDPTVHHHSCVALQDHPGAELLAELTALREHNERLERALEGWMLLADAWPEMRQRCLSHYLATRAALDALTESEAK